MLNLIKPTYIPGNFNSFLFIKFFSEEIHRDKFIDGQIYMNNISAFWDKVEKSDGVNDIVEGSDIFLHSTKEIVHRLVISKDGQAFIISTESNGKEITPYIVEAELGRQKNSERKIFCLYTLWLDTENKKFLRISPDIIKDWKYACLITNTEIFINRIVQKAQEKVGEMKSEPIYGFVEYIDKETSSPITEMTPLNKMKDGYVYQNEFRFSFEFSNIFGPYEDFFVQINDIYHKIEVDDLISGDEITLNGEVYSVSD
jgi:hypothetical protein